MAKLSCDDLLLVAEARVERADSPVNDRLVDPGRSGPRRSDKSSAACLRTLERAWP